MEALNILQIFSLALIFLVLWGVYYFIFHRKKATPAEKGKNMTNPAAKPLRAAKTFAALQQYQLIVPAHLAKDGAFADFDFIIVGCFGLLCVKCDGRGGEIYGAADDETWLQVVGSERISFENPLRIAAKDTRVVRDTLFAAKLKSVPVEAVCVMANNKAQLALPRSTGHYTVKDFKALLGKDKFLADKGVDIAKAADAVRKYLTE